MGKLDGKVAFITGASAGIAKAAALTFAREGANVTIIELNAEAGAQTEAAVVAQGGRGLFVQTDVTDPAQMQAAVERTVARFGGLNVIMNCACGSTQRDFPVHEMDLANWHHTIALNLLHPFLSCQYGIPHLMKVDGGSSINFASSLGMVGSVKPAYAAANGGDRGVYPDPGCAIRAARYSCKTRLRRGWCAASVTWAAGRTPTAKKRRRDWPTITSKSSTRFRYPSRLKLPPWRCFWPPKIRA